MGNIFEDIASTFKPCTVFALVGESGTGNSKKASTKATADSTATDVMVLMDNCYFISCPSF